MLKIDKKTGIVSYKVEAKLSPRKMLIVKTLMDNYRQEAVLAYISSINGNKESQHMNAARRAKNMYRSQNDDKLLAKGKSYYSKMYESFFDTDKQHYPSKQGLGQWLGVEIECFVPYSAFPNLRQEHHCEVCCEDHEEPADNCGCSHDCEGSGSEATQHRKALGRLIESKKVKRCSVKTDGSIEADEGYFGVELTITFQRSDRAPLKALCKVLNDLGAQVNKSCGLHVHLDQRDLLNPDLNIGYDKTTLMRRANNIGKALELFKSMVPKSRWQGNSYCIWDVGGLNDSRYYAINTTAFKKYKTIEVRLHSSTTDFTKINNWIDILLLLAYQTNRIGSINTLSDLCSAIDVPERLINYIELRQAKFTAASKTEVVEDNTLLPVEREWVRITEAPSTVSGTLEGPTIDTEAVTRLANIAINSQRSA